MTTSNSIPPVIGGKYRVLRELGRGGMGSVYLVEHMHTGEQLALKVLLAQAGANAEVVERFKREARAPARIRSDHVVRVTDADTATELGGAPFMVMEALSGADLERTLEQRGALPPHEVVWMLKQVASALDKAHSLGIVHRDLKPENIFLHHRDDGTPIVKILDFGISKMHGAAGGEIATAGLTKTGAVMGTPLYMSPEQARGRSDIGPATDIWSIGLVAINLLGGEVYWKAETIADLLLKIMIEPLPAPSQRYPQLGTRLDAWFYRSCEREPTARWASVGEQVSALAQALGAEGQAPIEAPKLTTTGPGGGAQPSLGRSTANVMARSNVYDSTANISKKRGVAAVVAAITLVALGIGGAAVMMRGRHVDGPAVIAAPAAALSVMTTANAVGDDAARAPVVPVAPVTSVPAPPAASATAAAPVTAPTPRHAARVTKAIAAPSATTPPSPPAVAQPPARPTATSNDRFNPQAP